MRIWKYKLQLTDRQDLALPCGAKLLTVQMQHGECCLWVLCDESAVLTTRRIAIYGTGDPISNEPGEYIATFQMHSGALVFHVFALPLSVDA